MKRRRRRDWTVAERSERRAAGVGVVGAVTERGRAVRQGAGAGGVGRRRRRRRQHPPPAPRDHRQSGDVFTECFYEDSLIYSHSTMQSSHIWFDFKFCLVLLSYFDHLPIGLRI